MAKGSIKGITIQIGGDTTGLDKALKETNKKSRDLQSELREVDKALKLDPGNLTLVKQKQDLLSQSIKESSEKLKILKEAQSQVEAQYKRGEIDAGQYRAFQRELTNTQSKLSELKKENKNVKLTVKEMYDENSFYQKYTFHKQLCSTTDHLIIIVFLQLQDFYIAQ